MSTPSTAKPPVYQATAPTPSADGNPFAPSYRSLPRPGTAVHWTFLWIAVTVVAGSLLLSVRDGREVIVPFVNKPLPGTCTFLRFTGIPCPGCGLTRSFISIGHGDLVGAWRYNPAGLFFFAVVALQIPYRILQIMRIRRGYHELRFTAFDNWVLVGLVVVLLVQWVSAILMHRLA